MKKIVDFFNKMFYNKPKPELKVFKFRVDFHGMDGKRLNTTYVDIIAEDMPMGIISNYKVTTIPDLTIEQKKEYEKK